MFGGGGGDGGAAEQEDELRQQRVKEGRIKINETFAQFDQPFTMPVVSPMNYATRSWKISLRTQVVIYCLR